MVVLLGVLVVGAAVGIQSAAGRRAVADLLEHYVSDGISGSMSVGSIESISPVGVVGHDVVFSDSAGRAVLRADVADLQVEWLTLLTSGRFVCTGGTVRGAQVVIETLPSGELTISEAFSSPEPSTGPAPVGDDVVRLERLEVSGVEVVVDAAGAPDIVARGLSAILLVHQPENGSLHLYAERIAGRAHIETPLPIDLDIERGTLALDGDDRRRAVIDLGTELDGESVAVNVVVRLDAHDEIRVDLRLTPSGLGPAIVAMPLLGQALAADAVSDSIGVTLALP